MTNRILQQPKMLGLFDSEIIAVLEKVRSELDSRPNNWIAMALTQGLEKTESNLSSALNTISIICGLLLTVSFSCILTPHDVLLALDNDDSIKVAYFSFMIASIIFYFACIMLSSMFLINLASVARDSDKFKILGKLGFVPTTAYTSFGLGYFTLIWGLTCHLYVLFG